MPTQHKKATYPSVDTAYEFVRPSYEWAQQRLDSVHTRIQTTLGFAAVATFGIPALVTSIAPEADFSSPWFLSAIGLFSAVALVGILSMSLGSLEIVSPKRLYETWLHYEPWEFRKNALYWAGRHYERNRTIINRKAYALAALVVFFSTEGALFIAWAVQGID